MFKTRVLTAALILPLFVGGMFWLERVWWAAALMPMALAGAWEWGGLSGYGGRARWAFVITVGATGTPIVLAAHVLNFPLPAQIALWVSVLFWLVCVPVWLRLGWRTRNNAIMAMAGWTLLVPTWIALVELQQMPWVLLSVLGIVWVADSAAYFAGRTWGRHKLAPTISPGKTWEGVAGGGFAVAVYYGLVWYLGLADKASVDGTVAAMLVLAIFPLSILGDLFESWIKRQAGVKDSGTLLPGHGGVLDRIDALTSTLPFAAVSIFWMLGS